MNRKYYYENQSNHLGTLLSDYILGLTSDEESVRIRSHLELCDSCRNDVLVERRMQDGIRSTLRAAGKDVNFLSRTQIYVTKRQSRLRYLEQLRVKQMTVALLLMVALMTTFTFQSLAYDSARYGEVSSEQVIYGTVTIADSENIDDSGLMVYEGTRPEKATLTGSVDILTPSPQVVPAPVPPGAR